MIQTTTKEVSKQLEQALKDAGYNHKSELLLMMEDLFDLSPQHSNDFSMSELWSMLPKLIVIGHRTYMLKANIYGETGISLCYKYIDFKLCHPIHNTNACDALADLVIWCIDNMYNLNIERKEVKG